MHDFGGMDWPDYDDEDGTMWTSPNVPTKAYLERLKEERTPKPPEPPVTPSKTAYTTVRVKWSAPVHPGSTVADGYDMACLLEETLQSLFGEWLGEGPQYEVYVQTDVR